MVDGGAARLILGLGNPGPRFAETRHNVGFACVDGLAEQLGLTWVDLHVTDAAWVASTSGRAPPLVLAKPSTFMNSSGEAARKLLARLKLAPSRMLVVYDDMDLPLGVLRLRERGSAGTHNGMRSVIQAVQTENFPRLRIGIGQKRADDARAFVLGRFDPHEQAIADASLQRAREAALAWAALGASAAMNRFNA